MKNVGVKKSIYAITTNLVRNDFSRLHCIPFKTCLNKIQKYPTTRILEKHSTTYNIIPCPAIYIITFITEQFTVFHDNNLQPYLSPKTCTLIQNYSIPKE